MLEGQTDIGADVDGKNEHVDGPTANLVRQVAEEERRDGLHDLIEGNGEVDVGEGTVVVVGDGGEGGEVDEGGEGGEDCAEDDHDDDEFLEAR